MLILPGSKKYHFWIHDMRMPEPKIKTKFSLVFVKHSFVRHLPNIYYFYSFKQKTLCTLYVKHLMQNPAKQKSW